MTWGQLRFQLKTGAPAVSDDLLDEYLNSRYEQVLEANDWQGARYHATIQTRAAYQSGSDTVTLTVGSTSVTGTGTTWTLAIDGLKFFRPGDLAIYTVTYVSGAALTLDRPYEGVGTEASGTQYPAAAYVLMQNVYPLPADVRSIFTVTNPLTGGQMASFSKSGLDRAVGPRALVNEPVSYCPYDETNESNPPVLKQIEFYPPPVRARGITFEYLHAALGFDGSTTSASPLPWVSATVLLQGCRADIAQYLAGQSETPAQAQVYLQQARGYEAKFQEELARLLRVEHTQRRVMTVVRMAARFSRHRLARASRGMRGWGPGEGGPN